TNGCIARTRQTGRRKTAKGNVHADSQSVLARRRTRRSTTDQQTRTRRRNRRTRSTPIRQFIPAPRRHDRPHRPRQQTRQNRRRIQKLRACPRRHPHVTLNLSKGDTLTTHYSILPTIMAWRPKIKHTKEVTLAFANWIAQFAALILPRYLYMVLGRGSAKTTE